MSQQKTQSSADSSKKRSFQELVVWQKAHGFVLEVYGFTRRFPTEESDGLTMQLRQCATRLAASIAEGYKKRSPTDKMRHFNEAIGALEQCRYYLILSKDLSYLVRTQPEQQLDEIEVLLGDFHQSIKGHLSFV